jgi:hypothetical protein
MTKKPRKAPARTPRAAAPRAAHRKARRAAHGAEQPPIAQRVTAASTAPTTKAAIVIAALQRDGGATLAELMATTGWQAHSVRGFLSGLRKRGIALTRLTTPGTASCYQASAADGR